LSRPRSISEMTAGRNFQFQVPSYWCNFHKNPRSEPFEQECPLRPRGAELLERTIWALSGNPRLRVVQASRLESSRRLCNLVDFKVQRRQLGALHDPGSALRSLTSEQKFQALLEASQQCAFSLENIDNDLNEIFLWAVLWAPLLLDGSLPNINQLADDVSKTSVFFFQNPGDAWFCAKAKCPMADARKILFLCRVVCGDMGREEIPACDSIVKSLTFDGRTYHRYLQVQSSEHQIYPEMMISLEERAPSPTPSTDRSQAQSLQTYSSSTSAFDLCLGSVSSIDEHDAIS